MTDDKAALAALEFALSKSDLDMKQGAQVATVLASLGYEVTRALLPAQRGCPFGDPTCPCQDGAACHYVAVGDTPAWAPPTEEQKAAWRAQRGEGGVDDVEPCPFCGGKWKISQEPHDNGYVAGMWYVFHTGKVDVIERCRIEIRGHFDTKQQAIDAINSRAAIADLPRSMAGDDGRIANLSIEREVWFQDARQARQLLQEWLAVDGSAWHTIRYENEKADLFTRTKAYLKSGEQP